MIFTFLGRFCCILGYNNKPTPRNQGYYARIQRVSWEETFTCMIIGFAKLVCILNLMNLPVIISRLSCLLLGLELPGTKHGEQCLWPMVRMDDGCYIYGWSNSSNLLKCKQ